MLRQGFTLIELLIVIAIIGILSVVVLTELNESRDRATDSNKIAGSKEVAKSMEIARDQLSGNFPTYSNTAAASIGLQSYISAWPSEVEFVDNTSNNNRFCVYAPLDSASEGDYYVVSHQSSGYRQTSPTLGDCIPN